MICVALDFINIRLEKELTQPLSVGHLDKFIGNPMCTGDLTFKIKDITIVNYGPFYPPHPLHHYQCR